MEEEKSKSQIKRESKILQNLGADLVQLSLSQLEQIPLPEKLLAAILEAKKIRSYSAKKRHIKFMGQMIRHIEDVTPIKDAFDKIVKGAELNRAQFHLVEEWRLRLISKDKEALTQFITLYPCDNIQQLRLLIRKAKSESEHPEKSSGAKKALFRFIRDLMT